jgi:CMP/dCMP kinase
MIITICGKAGSGKSSVSKALAAKLGYKRYSAGDIRREYAASKGITLEELNKRAVSDPTSDFLVDEFMKKMAEHEDNFVVESRLGFFFIPQSLKIFVDAKPGIRAKRTMEPGRVQENHESLSVAKKKLLARDKGDVERYLKLYKVNPFDMKHYDLVIDTSSNTVAQTLDIVLDFLRKKKKL